MIRTLIVDHHPALRAGVKVVLEAEGDMVVVGDTGLQEELLPLLRRTRPDVVLLDCHPPSVAGLRACRLAKCLLPPPRVLIYSAHADERLGVAARVAGADGLLGKNASALDLVQAIRVVHSGAGLFECIRPRDVQQALSRAPSGAPGLRGASTHGPSEYPYRADLDSSREQAHALAPVGGGRLDGRGQCAHRPRPVWLAPWGESVKEDDVSHESPRATASRKWVPTPIRCWDRS